MQFGASQSAQLTKVGQHSWLSRREITLCEQTRGTKIGLIQDTMLSIGSVYIQNWPSMDCSQETYTWMANLIQSLHICMHTSRMKDNHKAFDSVNTIIITNYKKFHDNHFGQMIILSFI